MARQGWRRGALLVTGVVITVAVITTVIIWFLPAVWSIDLLGGLVLAGLLAALLLSPAPRWAKGSFWRQWPAVDRLRDRLRARWRQWRPLLAVLAGVGVVAGVVLLVWQVPPALYGYVMEPKDRATAEAFTRTGLIAGFAGLAALIGLSYTARTYRATEQGHITDRYTKAIDQLGSVRLDVRLGGIYALERIAVDSARDHPTAVEVLGAYIRQHTTPPRRHDRQQPRHRQQPPPAAVPNEAPPQPAADVQAAVTVLGRLPARHGVPRGNLTGAQLSGAQLGEADLTGAQLREANLTNAGLREANLTDAGLHGANLTRAGLREANLTDARLFRANLTRAGLREANLTRAGLREANLTRAGLREANLTDARLFRANLTDAWLAKANLTTAKELTRQQLDSADGDGRTRLPSGWQPPAHWSGGPPVG